MVVSAASRLPRTRFFCRPATHIWWPSAHGTDEILWDTNASPEATRVNTSGADRDWRQGAPGFDRVYALRWRWLFHQRVRHQHRQTGVALLYDPARRGARQRDVGKVADDVPRWGRHMDRGKLRSRPQPHLLGRLAGETVEFPEPQADAARQDACMPTRPLR